MRGRWRDGLNKFRRDCTTKFRGERGRWSSSRIPGEYDDEIVPNKGASRAFAKKETHKKLRQVLKAEMPELLTDANWELHELPWIGYYEEEPEEEFFSIYDLMMDRSLYLDAKNDFANLDSVSELDDLSELENTDPFGDLYHFDPRHDDLAEAEEAGSAFDGDIRPVGYYDFLDNKLATFI